MNQGAPERAIDDERDHKRRIPEIASARLRESEIRESLPLL
jgi:hypothetical protein